MGYDFKIVRKIERVPKEHKAQGSDPSYHRFNSTAMGLWRVAMQEWCEATYLADAPELPAFPPTGFDDVDRAYEVHSWLDGSGHAPAPIATPQEIEAGKAYLAAYEDAVTRPAIRGDQVASYKFESNAGWLVTPEECRLLAAKIEPMEQQLASSFFSDAGFDDADALEMVEAWVAYQKLAAEYGGYRVR